MRTWILLAALLLVSIAAQGAEFPVDITLTWTNPTMYEDGTLIDPPDLTGLRFQCWRNNDNTEILNDSSVAPTGPGLVQSHVYVGLITQPGNYRCVGFASVVDGTESRPSDPTEFKVIGKPNAPVDLGTL